MDHGMHHHSHHHEREGHEGHDKHAGHDPAMFRQKFWLSLTLTLPTLYFSQTIQDLLGYQSIDFPSNNYVPALFGIIIFFYGGLVFLKSARAELADRQPGMMTLISLAITVAFGYSLLITLDLVEGMDFWWELSSLVTIMLLGHWLEMASVMSAQGALNELAKLLPDEAELVDGSETKTVKVSELSVGDRILIRPGASVAADGVVVKGESRVNESMISGESKPVNKSEGSEVIAGTINEGGSLTVAISKTGEQTALAGIMKLVAEAQSSKSKTQLLADQAAAYLFYIALAASFATAVGWSVLGNESGGFVLERVVAVLVIACPHALGLAIPLVTAISTSKAANAGLLVRKRSALESARNIDVILFDKTGTLTIGEQGVVGIAADNEDALLSLAASLEQDSEHPVGKAIVTTAKERKLTLKKVTKFQALKGRGVEGMINKQKSYVGGPQLLEHLSINLPQKLATATTDAYDKGQSVVYMIQDKQVLGAIMIADVIRDESKQAVSTLQSKGMRVAMLTGDAKGVAAWVADELGIDEYHAEVLPEYKSEVVKKLQADGSRVAMVGDGVNDAPALTQADIGIAIGAGTDVAIESAGIVLASSDPRGVAKVVTLSQQTYRKMAQNLAWATGYNAFATPLAAGVTAGLGFVLSPAVGAVLMSLSTVIVAINAQFLRRAKI